MKDRIFMIAVAHPAADAIEYGSGATPPRPFRRRAAEAYSTRWEERLVAAIGAELEGRGNLDDSVSALLASAAEDCRKTARTLGVPNAVIDAISVEIDGKALERTVERALTGLRV